MTSIAATPRSTLTVLAAIVTASLTSTAASAAPAWMNSQAAHLDTITVDVDYRRDRRVVKRRGRDDVEVDAPTTYVRSRRDKVDVDAPFTRVERSRRGVRVRAPFVDLWVPRR